MIRSSLIDVLVQKFTHFVFMQDPGLSSPTICCSLLNLHLLGTQCLTLWSLEILLQSLHLLLIMSLAHLVNRFGYSFLLAPTASILASSLLVKHGHLLLVALLLILNLSLGRGMQTKFQFTKQRFWL